MGRVIVAGEVFGRFTVLRREVVVSGKVRRSIYLCRCSCGNEKMVFRTSLISGASKSCGCFQKEGVAQRQRTHGESRKTVEYYLWYGMIGRCYNPGATRYERYGGRGITVCERWRGHNGYANFLADVGRRPSPKHSLDRWPNKDGNYEPGNVRWATRREQSTNTSRTRIIAFEGRSMALVEWAEFLGLKPGTLWGRLQRFPVHIAFTRGPLPKGRAAVEHRIGEQ